MSNSNAPFGFKFHGLYGDQAPPTGGLIQMKVSAGDTSIYGEGDPLRLLSTGYVTAFTKGTTASALAGVFKSCEFYSSAFGRRVWSNYFPGAGVSGDVLVSVTPTIGSISPRFLVQSAGATAVTMSSLWQNVDILSGSSTTASIPTTGFYRSTCSIDLTANIATTNTLPWRIVGLYADIAASTTSPGADLTTPYNWVLVEPNSISALGV